MAKFVSKNPKYEKEAETLTKLFNNFMLMAPPEFIKRWRNYLALCVLGTQEQVDIAFQEMMVYTEKHVKEICLIKNLKEK